MEDGMYQEKEDIFAMSVFMTYIAIGIVFNSVAITYAVVSLTTLLFVVGLFYFKKTKKRLFFRYSVTGLVSNFLFLLIVTSVLIAL